MLTYPNPTTDIVTVAWENKQNEPTVIQVYNALGQLIFEQKVKEQNSLQVDLSKVVNGVYKIQLIKGTNQLTQSIIKQ